MAGRSLVYARLLTGLNHVKTPGQRCALTSSMPLTRPFTTTSRYFNTNHASSIPTHEAIKLDYDLYEAGKSSVTDKRSLPRPEAFVICHGYLASRHSWRLVANALSQQHRLPVYALDMRNHGTSPHASSIKYTDMVSDLMRFFQDHQLKNVALVGHSMGAKAAMLFALHPGLPPDVLKYLISVDTPPYARRLRPQFTGYLDRLAQIHQKQTTSMDQAEAILKPVATNLTIRRMLLQNLHSPHPTEPLQCRIPTDILKAHTNELGAFPLVHTQGQPEPKWDGKTLFIQAQKDNRIDTRGQKNCNLRFPNNQLAVVNTGHHVHLDSPVGFLRVLDDFFAGKNVSKLWMPQPKTKDGAKRKKWLKRVKQEEEKEKEEAHPILSERDGTTNRWTREQDVDKNTQREAEEKDDESQKHS